MSRSVAVAPSDVILADQQVDGKPLDGAEQGIAGGVVRQPWPRRQTRHVLHGLVFAGCRPLVPRLPPRAGRPPTPLHVDGDQPGQHAALRRRIGFRRHERADVWRRTLPPALLQPHYRRVDGRPGRLAQGLLRVVRHRVRRVVHSGTVLRISAPSHESRNGTPPDKKPDSRLPWRSSGGFQF